MIHKMDLIVDKEDLPTFVKCIISSIRRPGYKIFIIEYPHSLPGDIAIDLSTSSDIAFNGAFKRFSGVGPIDKLNTVGKIISRKTEMMNGPFSINITQDEIVIVKNTGE